MRRRHITLTRARAAAPLPRFLILRREGASLLTRSGGIRVCQAALADRRSSMALGRFELALDREAGNGFLLHGGGTPVGFSGAGECCLPPRELVALRVHSPIVVDTIRFGQQRGCSFGSVRGRVIARLRSVLHESLLTCARAQLRICSRPQTVAWEHAR
jgi:hypothetical protein